MSERRVVITGLGVVTPTGNDLESFWKACVEGRSGITRITAFDPSAFDCQIAGQLKDFDPAPFYKNPKDVKRSDRYTQLAFSAARMAVDGSGLLNASHLDLTRVGVAVGSGIGGLITHQNQHTVLMERGPGRLSPFLIPMLIANIASGMISMEYGFGGPNVAVVTACATAGQSIGEAWRMIRDADCDVMLAGGSEAAICEMGIGGFAAMKALSTRANDQPEIASCPFDTRRDGFVMGEGAGVVILEELEHAKKRGAKIWGELAGYGSTADAHHLTAPHPEGSGASRAMRRALERAKLTPSDIGYINAHGTSTPAGDVAETVAIKHVFGDRAKATPVSSTKSMIGHLLGAAGAVEMAVCLKAIETSILPPTINLESPDPQCDLDYVPNKAREAKVDAVMNNSFGFGGHNACLVATRFVG